MLVLMLAATMAADAAPPPRAMTRPAVRCAPARTYTAGTVTRMPRKLDELPPGKLMLAVNKTVDGCPVNVLMQKDARGEWVEEAAPGARVSKAPANRSGQRRLERDR